MSVGDTKMSSTAKKQMRGGRYQTETSTTCVPITYDRSQDQRNERSYQSITVDKDKWTCQG